MALLPPTGTTYGRLPSRSSRRRRLSASATLPCAAYSRLVTRWMLAPTARSTRRLPTSPGSPASAIDCGARRMRWESRPRYRAATAVALQWLLCTPPMVMTQSASSSIASARRNSSFLTLFPDSCIPVRSSRLTYTSQPSGVPGRCHRCTGVGVRARWYRRVGAPGKSAHAGGDHGPTVIIPPADAMAACPPNLTKMPYKVLVTLSRVARNRWRRRRCRPSRRLGWRRAPLSNAACPVARPSRAPSRDRIPSWPVTRMRDGTRARAKPRPSIAAGCSSAPPPRAPPRPSPRARTPRTSPRPTTGTPRRTTTWTAGRSRQRPSA